MAKKKKKKNEKDGKWWSKCEVLNRNGWRVSKAEDYHFGGSFLIRYSRNISRLGWISNLLRIRDRNNLYAMSTDYSNGRKQRSIIILSKQLSWKPLVGFTRWRRAPFFLTTGDRLPKGYMGIQEICQCLSLCCVGFSGSFHLAPPETSIHLLS